MRTNDIFVTYDTETGTLRRYMTGGGEIRLTHAASYGQRISLHPVVIQQFRDAPGEEFRVDPDTTSPPPAA